MRDHAGAARPRVRGNRSGEVVVWMGMTISAHMASGPPPLRAASSGRMVAVTRDDDSIPEWERVVAALVRDRGPALVRFASLVSGDPDRAEDLVQDALVNTFGRLRNGFGVDQAEAYVRRSIVNANVDAIRRASRWRRDAHLHLAPAEAPAAGVDIDPRLDMRRALAGLAPRVRACLVLRYYDDLTVESIATTLGISAGTVKRYLSDGLAALGRMIEEGSR